MNTTDEIMAMAEEYACAASTVTELNYEKWHSDTARTAKLREQVSARQALRAAIDELVEQAKWAHHTPKLLSDTDAAADLAGLPRPGAEPYAYAVYFPDEDREELVHKLDDLLDDLTNCTHEVTPLHTAPPQASQPCDPAPDGVCEALECGNHGAEPVAWRHDHGEENGGWEYYENASCEDCQPLYTTPPQDAVDAKRYRWLRDRFLGPDYAWGNPATGVWAFETYAPVSADLGASIDAAIAAQKGKP